MADNALIPMMYDGGASIQTPSISGMAQQANALRQFQMQRQAQDNQNALRQLFQNPYNFNADGSPKPGFIQKVDAIDPKIGLQFTQGLARAQSLKADADLKTVEARQKKHQAFSQDVAEPAVTAYDMARARGATPAQAQAEAQAVYGPALANFKSSGTLSEDEGAAFPGNYDDSTTRSTAIRWKDWQQAKERAATDARKDRNDDIRLGLDTQRVGIDRERLSLEERGGATAARTHYEVRKAPDGTEFRYDVNTHDARELFSDKPYVPKSADQIGANKVGVGKPPAQLRSPGAMALQKFIQEHPNATSRDMQKFMAQGSALSAAQRSLEAGPIGAQLKSLGVATDHLNTLRQLNDAFSGGDEKTIAAAKAAWQREFGTPAPANMDVASQFVAPELIKAIEGTPGGVAERDELAKAFQAARGQSNVSGAIDTAFALMGGQMNGLRNQVVKVDKLVTDEEFDDMIPSSALDAMRTHSSAGGVDTGRGTGRAGNDYSHLWGGQ